MSLKSISMQLLNSNLKEYYRIIIIIIIIIPPPSFTKLHNVSPQYHNLNILRHVDPLLGNDRETYNYTTVTAK
jgi:hypothetical protein